MLDLAFRPDRGHGVPLYRQLADYLGSLVAAGRLAPGEKLPATRELAASLGLGRNTVTQAYEALASDGLLSSHVGQGTFVASRGAAPEIAAAHPRGRGFVWDGLLSEQARALRLPPALGRTAASGQIRFDFRGGRVDVGALPIPEVRRAYARAVSTLPEFANQLDPLGNPSLRHEIARLLVGRGIACQPHEVLVTNGAQQGIDLVARALLDPGDAVAVEQPGYFGAMLCFRAARARPVAIPVDEAGLRTDALARVLRGRRVKLVCVTPSAQMPTGVALSDARRTALLELADEFETPVLEDDYDSEFRYGELAQPALKTRDPCGQVAYVGTFSKALFPGLRLGYVVADPPLLARLALARFTSDFGSDALAQAAVADLLASGALERHVRRLRKLHAQRRDALLRALADHMPDGTCWSTPGGGHAVWVRLPPGSDPDAISAAALEAGIAYERGEIFYLDERGRDQLRLAFVNQPPPLLEEGVARLGEITRRDAARRRRAS